MIDEKIRRVALDPVAGTDLDDLPIRRSDQREDVQKNAILAILRVTAKLDVFQRRQVHHPTR